MWCKAIVALALIQPSLASQKLFSNFEPRTQVTDHSAIDLDQQELQSELAKKNSAGFVNALAIYDMGAHSKSYAEVKLTGFLSQSLPAKTKVSGPSVSGKTVTGKLLEAATTSTNILKIQYSTSDDRLNHVGCTVGASTTPVVNGCFADAGTLTVGDTLAQQVAYTYNHMKDNKNKRTLAGFSQQAGAKMQGYVDFEKFRTYYGRADYGDHWIRSAFQKVSTGFSNGNVNFALLADEGRVEAIKKGTAYLNIWMYVVREMEDALDDCKQACSIDACNDDKVSAWDEAVAFYSGSLVDEKSSYLLYQLANKRCANFGTCGNDGDDITGNSLVNTQVFAEFNKGQQLLLKANCPAARKNKERIVQLMTIPLIQGSIRYAYITGMQGDTSDKAKAEGMTFTAANLPMIHACSPNDATIIHQEMSLGKKPDFAKVKAAYERNYKCLGISCSDIGGLLDPATRKYYQGAGPCGVGSGSFSLSFTLSLIIGLLVTLYSLW